MGGGPGTCLGLGPKLMGCHDSHASSLSGHPPALARTRSVARQLGWGLAGFPSPAETWPVPGALAVGVMRGEREELITTRPSQRLGLGRGQAGGQSGSVSHNGGPASRVPLQVRG